MADSADKYIVFKREEFTQLMGELALPPYEGGLGSDLDCAPIAANILKRTDETEIKDAVVIRRQDRFASPCLATYAACIAIAYNMTDDQDVKRQLTQISDYFEDQAKLAAEEGFKLPDV